MGIVKNDRASVDAKAVQLPQPASTLPAVLPATRTYRDRLYTSRTLILPDDRTVAVIAGRITVSTDDTVALDYLQQHPDLEPLE
ncbi:hypothetical protein V2I80_12090 [Pseudomonas viridiflava]|uniref:hypothetical protein n=1 Tax=Pseudomonas viridiflava TaxID=33069 RepID=UPI002ECDB9C6|nr:hypothetical protein [Pseudomonas viridiflava]MEE3972379.1 hypothetical protein [Pseudomonas viridiflava]MEE4017220.1 hypothetical protein [Pseudomonas viridiflava]MEE4046186.1 hypothetical protein [Pseudomonas viridiflava]